MNGSMPGFGWDVMNASWIWSMMWVMLPVMLVSIAAVIWAIVDVVRREDIDSGMKLVWIAIFFFLWIIGVMIYYIVGRETKGVLPGSRDTPIEILKRRYAKGEIGKAEFEEMKKDLGY